MNNKVGWRILAFGLLCWMLALGFLFFSYGRR